MKILLTGGSGFIGRSVLNYLKNCGHEIIILTEHSHEDLCAENIRVIPCDLLSCSIKSLVKELRCDFCLHLAWYVKHNVCLTSEINFVHAKASSQLIDYFFEFGGSHFVFGGSVSEYDTLEGKCITETADPELLRPYARSKIKVTSKIAELASQGVSALSARIFYPVGRGDGKARLFGGACEAVALHKDFYCGIDDRWCYDFIDIDDLGRILSKLTLAECSGIVNVGSGKFINASQVLRKFFAEHSCQELLHFRSREGQVFHQGVYADLSALEQIIGRYDFKDLSVSLEECRQYYVGHTV